MTAIRGAQIGGTELDVRSSFLVLCKLCKAYGENIVYHHVPKYCVALNILNKLYNTEPMLGPFMGP